MTDTFNGFGANLPGGRCVKVGVFPGEIALVFTRPNDDGTPHDTVVKLSPEAFEALMAIGLRIMETGLLATTELALAVSEAPHD